MEVSRYLGIAVAYLLGLGGGVVIGTTGMWTHPWFWVGLIVSAAVGFWQSNRRARGREMQ
jgi:hypothetical protein